MVDWQGSESIQQAEHISPNKTGDNIQAKRVANYVWNPTGINPTTGEPTGAWERDTGGGSTVYSKPTDAYSLSDIDDSTSTEYYGYEDADGAWYIKKFASNAFTFVKGASGYSTAWTNRASQTYASYGSTF